MKVNITAGPLPIAAAALLMLEVAILGANGPLLAMVAASAQIALALGALLQAGSRSQRRLRGLLAPLLIALAGLLWALWPDLVGGQDMEDRVAPDLVMSAAVQLIGGLCAVLTGVLIAARRNGARSLIDWLLLLGILVTLMGLGLRQWNDDAIWGYAKAMHSARFTGTLLNANVAGGLFAMLAILAFGRALLAWVEQRRYLLQHRLPLPLLLSIAAFVTFLGACALTASRSAMLLLLLALPVILLADGTTRRHVFQRRYRPFLLAGAAAIMIVLTLLGGLLIERLDGLADGQIDRPGIWAHYWALGLERPHGFGLGGFSAANMHVLDTPAAAHGYWYINAAHNFVLHMMVEGGWPYAALMLLAGGWMLAQALWRMRQGTSDLIGVALLSALLVMLLCGSVDILLNVPAGLHAALLLLGLLWARAAREMRAEGQDWPDRRAR